MKIKLKKPLTFVKSSSIITFALQESNVNIISKNNSEKYSRGRRGAPAKGVGRATGARVQIPLSPFLFLKKLEKIKTKKCLTLMSFRDKLAELLKKRRF